MLLVPMALIMVLGSVAVAEGDWMALAPLSAGAASLPFVFSSRLSAFSDDERVVVWWTTRKVAVPLREIKAIRCTDGGHRPRPGARRPRGLPLDAAFVGAARGAVVLELASGRPLVLRVRDPAGVAARLQAVVPMRKDG